MREGWTTTVSHYRVSTLIVSERLPAGYLQELRRALIHPKKSSVISSTIHLTTWDLRPRALDYLVSDQHLHITGARP